MDLFEHHLYLYYFNGINPYPRIQMKFKSSSADPVQGNDFPHKSFGHNSVRQHKQFKCFFACQDPRKPIPTHKLYPNWKMYSFLKHIFSVFHFSWLLGCALAVDEKILVSKVDMCKRWEYPSRTRGTYFRWMFSADKDILTVFLKELIPSKGIHIDRNITFTCLCFSFNFQHFIIISWGSPLKSLHERKICAHLLNPS